MPLYEGISSLGLMNEKHVTVVFDFGHAFTKLGFAGETGPRAIVRSEVKCRKSGKLVPVFNFSNEEELKHHIIDFIYNIHFKYLLVSPKDRRVVIVENILGHGIVKKVMSAVLFRHYEVLSLLFVPLHLICLLTLGINTGLVLDIGYNEASIIPIYEGIAILKVWQSLPLASKSIHENLCQLLLDRAVCYQRDSKEKRLSSIMNILPEQTLEDIKIRCCFVSTLERRDRLHQNKLDRAVEPPPPPPSINYNLSGDCILTIPGTVREMASEILFEKDADNLTICQMILNAIMQCPIDLRTQLAKNLVIIGGTASMLGLKHRILAEVRQLFESQYADKSNIEFKIHTVPGKDNYAAWLGGAIIGCTESTSLHSVTRDMFIQSGTVPDWSDLSFNVLDDSLSDALEK